MMTGFVFLNAKRWPLSLALAATFGLAACDENGEFAFPGTDNALHLPQHPCQPTRWASVCSVMSISNGLIFLRSTAMVCGTVAPHWAVSGSRIPM